MPRVFCAEFSFLLLAAICLTSSLYAERADTLTYRAEQLDSRDGLSNSFINDVFVDSDGLLWIATWDGLNVYDGKRLQVFNYSQDLLEGIGNNVVKQIEEDASGDIWLATVEGVSRFEKQSGRFYNFFYSKQGDGQSREQKPLLATDTAGNVYSLTLDGGFTRYDRETQDFVPLPFPVPTAEVRKLIFDEYDRLWILYRHILEMYEAGPDGSYRVGYRYENQGWIPDFFVRNGHVFINSFDGNFFHTATSRPDPPRLLEPDKAAADILSFPGGYLIAWLTGGFSVYDQDFNPYPLHGNLDFVQDMQISSLSVSAENVFCLGTDGGGIVLVSRRPEYLGQPSASLIPDPGWIKQVRSFGQVGSDLWIGTKGNGIAVLRDFDPRTGNGRTVTRYTAPQVLDNNVIYDLEPAGVDALFISGDAEGIMLYDLKTKRFVKWREIRGSEHLPSFKYVFDLVYDDDGFLWLGTSGDGLIQLKLERDIGRGWTVVSFEQYKADNTDRGPVNNTIYSLAEGKDDILLVGCRYGGLSAFDKRKKRFRNITSRYSEGGLSNNDVLSLYIDDARTVWIGTSYGLNWIKEDSIMSERPVFKRLTAAGGLPNNTVHAITGSSDGQIWISTNNGLARINPHNLTVARYFAEDGLQGNEFSDGGVWKHPEGYLFWGGANGFDYILPEEIPREGTLPNVLLSGLQLGPERSDQKKIRIIRNGDQLSEEYTLKPGANFLEFQLDVVSFVYSGKSEFSYYLEGFDQKWNYSGNSGRVSYSNIAPGNYALMIRWSNGEGTWSDPTNIFRLTVQKPFWHTSAAYMIYLFVAGAFLFVFLRIRSQRMKMRHRLELEHKLRQKDDEIHQEKLDFYTNVTHELQTPLTLITGAAERCMGNGQKSGSGLRKDYFVRLIHQEANRLTYLIHQLLEFRKAEAGYMELRYAPLDLSAFLRSTASLFGSLSQQRSIRFHCQIEPDLYGKTDKDKLERILFNLLSNAFKHSPNGALVKFHAAMPGQDKTLEISVSNTGNPIPAEKLATIFRKFSVLDNANPDRLSTGIGLAYTYELVRLLKGRIEATSDNDSVCFRLLLPFEPIDQPADKGALNQDDSNYLARLMKSMQTPPYMDAATENNKYALLDDLGDQGRKSILLAEDESQIRFLLKDMLEEHYVVYEAENGKEALDLLKRRIPDLVVSDVMMPVMDGIELCERIKNTPATCHIPVIMLSAKGTIAQKSEGYEAGADAYVPKPFSSEYLLLRIRKLIDYQDRLHRHFRENGRSLPENDVHLNEQDRSFLEQVSALVREHLTDTSLNGSFLEGQLNVSKMQLYRRMKTMAGMTPAEFIRHLRMQHAAYLLQHSELSISEIVYESGFNNPSYFFREFKKRHQCSPGEYRDNHRIHS